MKQCFGYIRISDEKQTDGVSLEAQKDIITAFASHNSLGIKRWFVEVESASKAGRKQFGEMRALLKQGRADGVIFHKIDRSSRNMTDWAQIGSLYDISGVEVHFAAESIDFGTVSGRLVADMQAVVAAHYSRNLSQEVIKGLEGRLKQGLYPFKAPFGYVDRGRGEPKTIHAVHGDTVRTLYDLYATGEYSLHSLTKAANTLGLKTEKGRPLSKTSIEKILRNIFYTGLMLLPRTGVIYQGRHTPLISMELYQTVADIRAGRDNKKSTKHNLLFAGLFRCALCGQAMIGERHGPRTYYRCHLKTCDTKTIREDVLDVAVRAFLAEYELDAATHGEFVAEYERRNCDELAASRQRMQTLDMAKVEQKISRLTDLLIEGAIDKPAFAAKKRDLIADKTRIEQKLVETSDGEGVRDSLKAFLNAAKNLVFQYDAAGRAEKRRMIRLSTSKREVAQRHVVLEPSQELADLKLR